MENKTIHNDCFAYNETDNEKHQCCALTERVCNYKKCNFYKGWENCDDITKQLISEQKQLFLK